MNNNEIDLCEDAGLSERFWEQFVQRYWHKRPIVLRDTFGEEFVSQQQIFDALVHAAKRYRYETTRVQKQSERGTDLRFHIDRGLLVADVEDYLPEEGDESVIGYLERIEAKVEGRPFELFASKLQAYDFDLWMGMRHFVRSLFRLVGIPLGCVNVGVFMGNHKKTSFGVHKDNADTFLFIVEGDKELLLWPDSMRERIPAESTKYDEFRDEAIVLEAEPGDVIYFPHTYWHVGESSSAYSISLPLGISPETPIDEQLMQQTRTVLKYESDSRDFSDGIECKFSADHSFDKGVPSRFEPVLRSLRKISEGKSLEDCLILSCINQITASGFCDVPEPLPMTILEEESRICVRAGCEIVVTELPKSGLTCSVNGHAFSVGSLGCVKELIRDLNVGATFATGDLLDKYGRDSREMRMQIRMFLNKLWSLRALTHTDIDTVEA